MRHDYEVQEASSLLPQGSRQKRNAQAFGLVGESAPRPAACSCLPHRSVVAVFVMIALTVGFFMRARSSTLFMRSAVRLNAAEATLGEEADHTGEAADAFAIVDMAKFGGNATKAAGRLLNAANRVCMALAVADPSVCLPLRVSGLILTQQSGAPSPLERELDRVSEEISKVSEELGNSAPNWHSALTGTHEIGSYYDNLQTCLRRSHNYTACYWTVPGHADLSSYRPKLQKEDFRSYLGNILNSDEALWGSYLVFPLLRNKLQALLMLSCAKYDEKDRAIDNRCDGHRLWEMYDSLKTDLEGYKEAYEAGRAMCRSQSTRLACKAADPRGYASFDVQSADGCSSVSGPLSEVRFTNITALNLDEEAASGGWFGGSSGCQNEVRGGLGDLRASPRLTRLSLAHNDNIVGELSDLRGANLLSLSLVGPESRITGRLADLRGARLEYLSLRANTLINGTLADLRGTNLTTIDLRENAVITGSLADLRGTGIKKLQLLGNTMITGDLADLRGSNVKYITLSDPGDAVITCVSKVDVPSSLSVNFESLDSQSAWCHNEAAVQA